MDKLQEKSLPDFTLPPIQTWHNEVFYQAGINVDVLRLDLIHPTIGGNKWMKLKGFIQQAVSEGKKGIITKGGPWSNHIHACAWLCQMLGLECHTWIKGNSAATTAMLADAVSWKATIRYINRTEFYDENITMNFANENNLLYVPMGGADTVGVVNVSKYMQQLNLPVYHYAVCAMGTATTLGGLAFVSDNFNHIIGVEAGTNDVAIQQKIKEWQQALPRKKLTVITDYTFGGFARYAPELIDFMNNLYASRQLPTDIVYTGKLLYAVQDMAGKSYFPAGATILVVHSGGLQGNRSLPGGLLQF